MGKDCTSFIFSGHAMERAFERGISIEAIEQVVTHGRTIVSYPQDMPYPSELLLGFINGCPVHVVVAQDADGNCIVVTAYIPNEGIWDASFTKKRDDMECVICKHGHTVPGHVTVKLEREEAIILVKEVEAEICENCGHYYVSSAMAAKVMAYAEQAMKKGVTLEVVKLPAA
jgi:YgiT-type zinc finger domain-containing protein